MEQRRAFASFELLFVVCYFSVGLALSLPILFHPRWHTLSSLTAAVLYLFLALPALLAICIARSTRAPEPLREGATPFLVAFGLPGTLALLMALWKLCALVTLPL